MHKLRVFYLLLIFAGVGFILRLNNISERSLWTDEFFTFFESTGHGVEAHNFLGRLSKNNSIELLKARDFKSYLANDRHKSIKDVTSGIFNTDTHPPFYFWVINTWMKIFGDSVLAIRFFSVLMGLFAIILAYQVGNYLFGKAVAHFCALFVSVCAFSVRYSQEARPYSLILVLALLSWIFLLRFEKSTRNLDAFWFTIFNSCGVYTHFFYVFIVLAQFIYFSIIYRDDSEKLNKFYLALICSVLILLIGFMPLIKNGYNFQYTEWIFGYPGLAGKLSSFCCGILNYFLIFDSGAKSGVIFISICLLIIISVFYTFKEATVKYSKQVFFCLLMFLTPVASMFLIDIIENGELLRQERFWMFSFFGFIPLMGYLLNYVFLKNKIALFLIVFILIFFSFLSSRVQFGPAPKYASRWINQESIGKVSAVFIYNTRGAVFAQAYYLDNDIYLIPVSNAEQLKNGINKIYDLADRIFMVRHYHRSDNSLMSQPFMEAVDINSGFRFIKEIRKDNISVAEYGKLI